MAAIPIGIDLCHSPLLVGCQIANTVAVQEGSKGARLNYSGPKGRRLRDLDGHSQEDVLDELQSLTASAELFECFEDARNVAKSFFGSPNIRDAVVVVPNGYDYNAFQQSIVKAGDRAFIRILQIIPEHIAVAAAYAHKTKPTENPSTITIISSTSGACDVYRVSLRLTGGIGYTYQVERPSSHGDEAGHHAKDEDENSRIGKSLQNTIESLVSSAMADFHPVFASSNKPLKEEKVVFVGKSNELLNMREIINKGFTLINEWKDTTNDSDQLAVYGAAVLAFLGTEIEITLA